MSEDEAEIASPPRQRRRYSPLEIGILAVKGSGIRVVQDRNDRDQFDSIQKTILTCKDKDSAFFRTFKGFMHEDMIKFNGRDWSKFSYRWLSADTNAGMSPEILAGLFRACNQVKHDPDLPYEGTNIKAIVTVLAADEVPMGDFYNDHDIVKHCTSQEQRFKLWRAHVQPYTQGQGFFWSDAGHDDLTTTIAQVKALINTAPTVGGISF